MDATITKTRWFWPWQDDKEEAWLEEMSTSGWHLTAVKLMGRYTFKKGVPRRCIYRLDYMWMDKKKFADYLQIFQDAGWEYIGEMSNWRYWRKPVAAGETAEIFTDNESKIKKYQRVLAYLVFFLLFLVIMGINLYRIKIPYPESTFISIIYWLPRLVYAIIIPIYVVVVLKLMLRIRQLKMTV